MAIKRNDYVTTDEFGLICNISRATVNSLVHSKKIKTKKRKRNKRIYIPKSEIERFNNSRIFEYSDNEIERVRKYYLKKMETYSDALTLDDVQKITGVSIKTIQEWRDNKLIITVRCGRTYLVAKEDLLEFVSSQFFVSRIHKSKEQIADYVKLGLIVLEGDAHK